MRRALAIDEKSLGPEHPNVAQCLNNLAYLRAERGDWAEAARLHQRAKPIMTAPAVGRKVSTVPISPRRDWPPTPGTCAPRRVPSTVPTPTARTRARKASSWRNGRCRPGAADALAQMSVRFAKGTGRSGQPGAEAPGPDRAPRTARTSACWPPSVRQTPRPRSPSARPWRDSTRSSTAIDARLAAEFPDYADPGNAKPLTIAGVQSLLRPRRGTSPVPGCAQVRQALPEESLVWAVTKEAARLAHHPARHATRFRIALRRCAAGSMRRAGRRLPTGRIRPPSTSSASANSRRAGPAANSCSGLEVSRRGLAAVRPGQGP